MNTEVISNKYLGVVVSVKGTIFAHPCDGSDEAAKIHEAARERGDWPYTHLYEGDDVEDIVWKLRSSEEAFA